MNLKVGDYNGLLCEIATATGRDFTAMQLGRLIDEFKKINWNEAHSITANYIRMSRFPQNVYGNLLEIIGNKRIESFKKIEKKPDFLHPITEQCTFPEEIDAVTKTISLLSKFEKSGELLHQFGVMLEGIYGEANMAEKVEEVYQFYLEKAKDRSNIRKTITLG